MLLLRHAAELAEALEAVPCAASAPYCFIIVRIWRYCFQHLIHFLHRSPALPRAMRLRRLPSMTL